MKVKYWLLVLLAFGIFHYAMDTDKIANEKDPTSIQDSDSKNIIKELQGDDYDKKNERLVASIKVRREFISPVLEEVFKKHQYCPTVVDDNTAFEKLKAIASHREEATDFIDFMTMDDFRQIRKRFAITPELERKIQNASLGHICFWYTNPTTLEAFRMIWDENPCSEAAVLALMRMVDVLATGEHEYLVTNYISGPPPMENTQPFYNEIIQLFEYIVQNYPNTWEGKLTKTRLAEWSCPITSDPFLCDEAITVLEEEILYLETNGISDTKYALFRFGKPDVTDDLLASGYDRLRESYLEKCNNFGLSDQYDDGRNLKEALNYYKKYYAMQVKIQDKYPAKYHSRGTEDNRCHRYIKKHAPHEYRPDPPE